MRPKFESLCETKIDRLVTEHVFGYEVRSFFEETSSFDPLGVWAGDYYEREFFYAGLPEQLAAFEALEEFDTEEWDAVSIKPYSTDAYWTMEMLKKVMSDYGVSATFGIAPSFDLWICTVREFDRPAFNIFGVGSGLTYSLAACCAVLRALKVVA